MELLIIAIFIIGYFFITTEHVFNVNKSAVAMITGVSCWVTYISFGDKEIVLTQLEHHIGEIAGVVLFLMAAMTIVELIDMHEGFDVITNQIKAKTESKLLWIISFTAFFLSAFLDNLTTTIVMVILLRKLIESNEKRILYVGMVIIAANAGGAWSPIGDVTTTMLWIKGNVSTGNVILKLIIPSLAAVIVPLTILSSKLKGKVVYKINVNSKRKIERFDRIIIFISGIAALIFIPIFKMITHLPPYMGAFVSLAFLWILTEVVHKKKEIEDKHELSVSKALTRTDMPSVLFFLGILLSVAALQAIGTLTKLGGKIEHLTGNYDVVAVLIGLFSSVIDNVPLVAAAIGMYPLSLFPADSRFWELLTYCAGTGGSILIIGSAAGVAAMGLEKIKFGWYLKNISFLALIGYISGIIVYLLQSYLLSFIFV